MKRGSRSVLASTMVLVLCISFFSVVVVAGGGSSSPPPPPPPCAQKLQGCYNTEDFRQASTGLLTPETFGYFMAATACIGGGCTCSLSHYESDVKVLDPDEDAGACSCIGGTSYQQSIGSNGCCGDDLSDCGLVQEELRFGEVIDQFICVLNDDFLGGWVSAEANSGDIAPVECSGKQYVSDGLNWIECGAFETQTINNHEYMCTDVEGERTWVECCGAGSCNSINGGLRLGPGSSIEDNNNVYYCLSDGTFGTNLDGTNDQTACQNAGYGWTGTLCCSENDDLNESEYYNDISGGRGGCWEGESVFAGDFVPNQDDVANFDGTFYGCGVDDASLLALTDFHRNDTLITNTEVCFQDANRFYLCTTDNTWEFVNGNDRSHYSEVIFEVEPNPTEPAGCCPTGKCWNGDLCVDNQRFNSNAPGINGFRCVDGNWTDSVIKIGPEEDVSGFCPESQQCLVTPHGNPNDNNNPGPGKNPQCISHGQFIENDFCEDGKWTSRTKFIAEQLVGIADGQNEYVVFCDSPENTLNNLDYQIEGTLAASLISQSVENVCVLLYADNVIIGATLKEKLETDATVLSVLDKEDCTVAFNNNENTYIACSGTNSDTVWYNSERRSLIYASQGFALENTGFFSDFVGIFNSIIESISGNTLDDFDTQFFDNLRRFEKLYISKKDSKEIKGTIEGFSNKRLIIEYSGFTTNLCDFVDQYNEKRSDLGSRIVCEQDGSTYYVVSEGNEFTKIDPSRIWTDLTSKLRIS